LQYALLHATGYDVSIEDLKNFRQLGSKLPGHPESNLTPGIEVTTGPLGQGVANAVGVAVAEANLAARFNKPDAPKIVDHYTYCIAGDGCMMEGLSNEASSLAGHWGLGKLILFYDDNKISIDGDTKLAFTEDVSKRYKALGWHTLHVEDGHTNVDGIRNAIQEAQSVKDRPTLIKLSTIIGFGAPNKAGGHDVHGAPLGVEETQLAREALGWQHAEFEVPQDVYDIYRQGLTEGAKEECKWAADLEEYGNKYPREHDEFKALMDNKLPDLDAVLPIFTPGDKGLATRQHSQTMLNAIAPSLPGLIGGSADLAVSNLSLVKMYGDFQKGQYEGRNLRFGVREHGMAAICNGIALYGMGLIPYCATFFNFTDYMRGAMRLSSLSHAGVIYVLTHDSIGLGEDGPTHQPVEQLASFRSMPNTLVVRPAGGNETAGAYKVAVANRSRPTLITLSRQAMPNTPEHTRMHCTGVMRGAYIVREADSHPDVLLMATGSELQLAYDAAEDLSRMGVQAQVVSMVCWELFEEQDQEYKNRVLPPDVDARVSVEASVPFGWAQFLGAKGRHVGIPNEFGTSGPTAKVYQYFGITVDNIVKAAMEQMPQ
ncbi:transketolase, partial [Dunaliella salina]